MKTNKFVFSSIAALALASSAFGSFDFTFTDGANPTDWKEQTTVTVGSNPVSIDKLGWNAGAIDAIKTSIGAASATAGHDSIVAELLTQTADKTAAKDGANKIDVNYGTAGTGITAIYGADYTSLTQLTLSSGKASGATMSDLIKEYNQISKEKAKVQLVSDILGVIKHKTSGSSIDSEDLNTSANIELSTTDQAQLKKVYKKMLAFATETATQTALGKAIDADGKILTTGSDDMLAAIKAIFADGDGELNVFKTKHKATDVSNTIKEIGAMQTTVNNAINSLIASSKEADKAGFVKAQLDDAIRTLERYQSANEDIAFAQAVVDKAAAAIFATGSDGSGKFGDNTGLGGYKDIHQSIAAKTSDGIKQELITKLDGVSTGNGGINAKDTANDSTITSAAWDRQSGTASIDQLKAYMDAKKPSAGWGDNTDIVGSRTDKIIMKDADLDLVISELYDAMKEHRQIDFTGLKLSSKKTAEDLTIDAVMDELSGTSDELFNKSGIATTTATKALAKNYNAAIKAIKDHTDYTKLDAANVELANAIKAFAAISPATQNTAAQAKEALGESLSNLASADASVAQSLSALTAAQLDADGNIATKASVEAAAATEWASLTQDEKNALGTDGASETAYQTYKVNQHNAAIQKAANNVASAVANAKKDSLAVEGLSTLNIQLNNMNKRLGEIRGLDGEIGVWLRTWGGKMSADNDSFKYYSTQLGADKKTAMKDGDLYLGVLVGYDNVKSDIKSNAYSVGAYASYIDNSGFFADGVMKFVSTKNERSGFDLSNQQTLLASIEGGYRFDMSDGFYVEPSLEFVTGHVGEYKSKEKGSNTTLKVDSFTPVVFKPQVFVGGSADAFTYRAGIGGVLSIQGQDASVTIANLAQNLNDAQVDGSSTVKLSKNNHGFASIGGSFKASENFRINLGVERSFGGDLTNDYEVNMTLRYGF